MPLVGYATPLLLPTAKMTVVIAKTYIQLTSILLTHIANNINVC